MKNDDVKWKGFARSVNADKALELLMDNTHNIGDTVGISVEDAADRVLAVDIIAPFDLPGFTRSAMDGYAVLSRDTHGASETNPLELQITGISEIGGEWEDVVELTPGNAIRISTGAPLPNGADAVIRVEDCEEVDDTLVIYASVSTGRNVAKTNEDISKGELIFSRGRLIKSWDIAMLVSMGYLSISVYRRPRVAVLSTGGELVPTGTDRKIGQVYDSNRPAIVSKLKSLGCEIVFNEQCDDNPDTIRDIMLDIEKIENLDLVVTTGGTSVGKKDYMAEVITDIGELWVRGVSIRPGKPLILGKYKKSITKIIALPGYPLAAFINFELFVQRIVERWTKRYTEYTMLRVKLKQRVPSKSGIRDFVRLREVAYDNELDMPVVEIIRITGAGILSSLVNADYMLQIAEDIEGYNEGDVVLASKIRG